MQKILECVPNFSEGRNSNVIAKISSAIDSVEGVKLLHVDAGESANRTVISFAGKPDAVIQAAFLAIKLAAELIDMSSQSGTHPRLGATDVCPLIPITGVTMEEVVAYSIELAKRVGDELQIPVYLYEYSQQVAKRKNLARIREGEYEGMFQKIKLPEWKPDFGPEQLSIGAGATVIGARKYLIAYNINLNTKSVKLANEIAKKVRESGYVNNGQRHKGKLKHVKAIGWFNHELDCAQVSMNVIDFQKTPIYQVYEEVKACAQYLGVDVNGSELIGLIPLEALLKAGEYYFLKQNDKIFVLEAEIINVAVKNLGLSNLSNFDAKKRVIEFVL